MNAVFQSQTVPTPNDQQALEAPAQFANMAEFAAWLESLPPTGRTQEEIDQHVREERDSWGD